MRRPPTNGASICEAIADLGAALGVNIDRIRPVVE
jgi:hypothetical protein